MATSQLSKLSSPWTVNTWLSFYLSYFLFFVFYHGKILFYPIFSFFISRRQKEKHQIAVKVVIENKFEQNYREGKFLRLCVILLLFISYISFIIEAVSLSFIPLFTEHTPHAYSAFHLKGLHYFTTLFVLVPMLLPFLYQKEGKISLFSGLSFFLALILPILLVSRFQLLFSLFLFVFSALYQGLRIRKSYILLLFGFLLMAYIFLTIERAHSVSYLMGSFEM